MSLKKFAIMALLVILAALNVFKIFAVAGWWIFTLILLICIINWVAIYYDTSKTKKTP